jgi:hypothetical protein
MKSYIQIPEGLKVPASAESKPFTAEVQFLVADGMLKPISIAGKAIPMGEASSEEEGMMSEESTAPDGSMEHEAPEGETCPECGDDMENCSCEDMGKGMGKGKGMAKAAPKSAPPENDRGGFMVAIERALAAPKR